MHYEDSKAHNGVRFDGRGSFCVGVAYTLRMELNLAGYCLLSQWKIYEEPF